VNEIILPVASRLMDPAQARGASADGYLAHVLMHEICHGSDRPSRAATGVR